MKKLIIIAALTLALGVPLQSVAQTKLAVQLYGQINKTHERVSVVLNDQFDDIDLTSMSDLGVLFELDSDFVSATECYKTAIKKAPCEEYAYHKLCQKLALTYSELRLDSLAISTIEACIAQCRNDNWRIMLEAGYGKILYDANDQRGSAAHYLLGAKLGEQQEISTAEIGELYCFAAQSYLVAYEFEEAERCARRAMEWLERDFSEEGDHNYTWSTRTLRYTLYAQHLMKTDERTNIVFVEQ